MQADSRRGDGRRSDGEDPMDLMLQTRTNAVKYITIGSALFFLACLAFCACGQGSATGESTGSTASGGPQCKNVFVAPGGCGECILEHCCAEAAACGAADNCVACYWEGI